MPVVVVVGGGFAGLAAARGLRGAQARVILIDRTNHHVFQPLLYQVATSVLSPGQIGFPLRGILRRQPNATVLLGEVEGVDTERRCVLMSVAGGATEPVNYDYLVLATGVTHSYFGHDEFARHAPGLKTLGDALEIRNRILQAFESAETERDPARRRDYLTFVLVGGGPTGVEMAGAIAVLTRSTLRSEFRHIDPTSTRIVLVDRGERVLGAFAPELSAAAQARLADLGVEVRLGQGVEHIDEDGVIVSGERIASRNVFWTAGVAPSPAGAWLGVATDKGGRVRVNPDLTVPGRPEILVVGDTASLDQDGKPLPGVAQVALQQGRYAGRLLACRIAGKPAPPPFRYFNKGSMAVVGKGFAVMQSGKVHSSGKLAWLAWVAIHLQFLANSSLRLTVFLQWAWTYVTNQRGARLIVKHHGAAAEAPSLSQTQQRS